MIVVGLDVHKHALTAVAVDELGRVLAELTSPVEAEPLLAWARSLPAERLWALEDCRHVTRALEQALLAAGEQLVRVPPRLTAPQRRRGRRRGKSDAIDALAVARAALQEPKLDRPRAGEERLRELKLVLDHRDDLVAERRRAQQRLRWHLHELDPTLRVPLGALDRALWLNRLGRRLARREQTTQVRIARDLLARCRSLTRSVLELERELQERTQALAPALLQLPGCAARVGQAALRDRPGRAFSKRRPARPSRRRRTVGRELGQAPTPPARPRWQPPAQLRPAPDRGHPGPRPSAGSRLPRAQAGRGQEPPRGAPLPQAPARSDRLHDAQERAVIDIGATLAHTNVLPSLCASRWPQDRPSRCKP